MERPKHVLFFVFCATWATCQVGAAEEGGWLRWLKGEQAADGAYIRFCAAESEATVVEPQCSSCAPGGEKCLAGCGQCCGACDQCGDDCGNRCRKRFGNGRDGCGNEKQLWSAWAWGAPTYFSQSVGSAIGMSEGLNLGYRLSPAVGLYASIGLNHTGTDAETQILGTVGVQRFGNPDGEDLFDRTSIWVLFDQGFATTDNSTSMHQIRVQAGFVASEGTEVGMEVAVPTSTGGGGGFLSPMGGAGFLTTAGNFVGPYWKQDVSEDDRVTVVVGYGSATSGVVAGAEWERKMNDRVNWVTDFKIGGESSYAFSSGLAVGMGAADTKRY